MAIIYSPAKVGRSYGSLEVVVPHPSLEQSSPSRQRSDKSKLLIGTGAGVTLLLVLTLILSSAQRAALQGGTMPGVTVPLCVEMTCGAEVSACSSDPACESAISCLFDICSWATDVSCESCLLPPAANATSAGTENVLQSQQEQEPSSPTATDDYANSWKKYWGDDGGGLDDGASSGGAAGGGSEALTQLRNCSAPCLLASEADDSGDDGSAKAASGSLS